MKGNKIYIIIGLLVVAGIAAYFMLRPKSGGAIAAVPAVNADDEAAYQQLLNLLRGINKEVADTWIGDIAREFYEGTRVETDPTRLINGKVTKTGALLSAWATSWYPGAKDVPGIEDKNRAAYAIFYGLKGKSNTL